MQILHDTIMSASGNIPSTKQNKKYSIPGWNENVQHSKEIALFWRSIWLNNNLPRQGVFADIMRRTRAKYHYCIPEVKKNELLHKKQAMARSFAENNTRNLLTECRKVIQKVANSPNYKDTFVGDKNITELFGLSTINCIITLVMKRTDSLHYRKITVILKCIILMAILITFLITMIIHTHDVTVKHVTNGITNAITHLKSKKNDKFEGLSSDNFKNGTHSLNVYISLLFSTMLSQGTAPASLLLSSMVPLIKSKRGCKCDFNSNITITINRLLGKIFHTVLLKLQHASLFTDSLQFDIKPNSFLLLCTYLFRNTIEYYNKNCGDCY